MPMIPSVPDVQASNFNMNLRHMPKTNTCKVAVGRPLWALSCTFLGLCLLDSNRPDSLIS